MISLYIPVEFFASSGCAALKPPLRRRSSLSRPQGVLIGKGDGLGIMLHVDALPLRARSFTMAATESRLTASGDRKAAGLTAATRTLAFAPPTNQRSSRLWFAAAVSALGLALLIHKLGRSRFNV